MAVFFIIMTLEIDRHLGRPVSPDEILDQLSSTGQKTLTLADVRSMYERFKEKYEGTDLFVLLDRLISPVLEKEVTLTSSKVNLKAVDRTSSLGEQSADVVNFAYNSRYVKNGGEVIDMATDSFDFQGNSKIILAEYQLGEESVVLATFRVVHGEDLDIFRLFENVDPYKWPHVAEIPTNGVTANQPGELARFSLHPVFDFIGGNENSDLRNKAREFKGELLRKMWPEGMTLLRNRGVTHPYFILAPHVEDFVVSSGINPVEIQGVVPSESEYATGIRNKFKEYWFPKGDPSQQPRVYLAPWTVSD